MTLSACAKDEADFLVADQGSIVAFTPMTEAAREACGEEGFIVSEDWQWMGLTLLVDYRMAEGLVEKIQEEGLTVAQE